MSGREPLKTAMAQVLPFLIQTLGFFLVFFCVCGVGLLWGEMVQKSAPFQNHFWRPQKVGLVSSVPVSSKGNNRAWINRGRGTHQRWGGSKTVFGEGSCGTILK